MTASERRLLRFIAILYIPACALAGWYVSVQLHLLLPVYAVLLSAALLLIGEAAIRFLPPAIVFYLFFGVLTTLVAQGSFNAVNFLCFGSLAGGGGLWWLLPQSISWVAAVLFAFLTNRCFVFKGQKGQFWAEMRRFFQARLGSGIVVEYLGMLLLVNGLGMAQAWAKLFCSVVVVIVNYIVSRFLVFKTSDARPQVDESSKNAADSMEKES